MRSFQTILFVITQLIIIFLLINAHNAKTVPYIGKHMIWIRFHCMSWWPTVTIKKTA